VILLSFLLLKQSAYSPINNNIGKIGSEEVKCEEKSYGFDCDIIQFLKENIGWKNIDNAKLFCSYDKLGNEGDVSYLNVSCESFYVVNKQVVCPDDKSRNDCFIDKKCDLCEKQDIEPKLALDSGVVIPVRLTKSDQGYSHEEPLDGSLYSESLKKIFPANMIEKLSNSKVDLTGINREMAEKSFKVKAYFEVKSITSTACNKDDDCSNVVMPDAMMSDCPRVMKCINDKCTTGCYDMIDHEELPK
jgi:hypothetical protein